MRCGSVCSVIDNIYLRKVYILSMVLCIVTAVGKWLCHLTMLYQRVGRLSM